MNDIALGVFKFLWPQKGDGDSPESYSWRVKATAVLYLLLVMQMTMLALMFGYIQIFGFDGFAYAGAVQSEVASARMERGQIQKSVEDLARSIGRRLDSSEATGILTLILMLRTRECQAINDRRASDALELTERRNKATIQYRNIMGEFPPPLDPC